MDPAQHDTIVHQIAFSMVKGLMVPVAQQLLSRVGGVREFFEMSASELAAVNGFTNKIFADDYRASLLERASHEAEYAAANQITPLFFTDPHYPQRLAACDDAPLMLYGFGTCDLNNVLPIAVVGTRHATAYGVDFVRRLVEGLAAKCAGKVMIVSGLAFGIDIAAHRAALDAGLPTVAVVAHGLNTVYPAQHRSSAVDIVRHGGMMLTEYTSTDPVHKGNFLARNRIVAGMCDATLVAESAEHGGALVTARLASGYNRDVLALPGRITDHGSEGCNNLISRHAAQLVTSADDVIDALCWPRTAAASAADEQPTLFENLSPDEERLIGWLRDHPDSQLNDIAVELDIAQGRLNGLLLELEFKELVIRKPGARYCTVN